MKTGKWKDRNKSSFPVIAQLKYNQQQIVLKFFSYSDKIIWQVSLKLVATVNCLRLNMVPFAKHVKIVFSQVSMVQMLCTILKRVFRKLPQPRTNAASLRKLLATVNCLRLNMVNFEKHVKNFFIHSLRKEIITKKGYFITICDKICSTVLNCYSVSSSTTHPDLSLTKISAHLQSMIVCQHVPVLWLYLKFNQQDTVLVNYRHTTLLVLHEITMTYPCTFND